MSLEHDFPGFLKRNRISDEQWRQSRCDWPQLLAIAEDHERHLMNLRDTAEFFARVVQKIPDVHSVRWRVKDTEHLLEKIVRKRLLGVEKYASISVENYFEIVTDLVGLRALHLFKDDCFQIDTALRESWSPIEVPIAFVRDGDHAPLSKQFAERGLAVRPHPEGYRSIHYVFASQPMQRKVVVEVQVRTVFEEGWSEIDHRIRYPNFSDNALVTYFLTIFNRLAGSADEMGGFVRGLAATLADFQVRLAEANSDKEKSLKSMEDALSKLDMMRQKDADSRAQIEKLKTEVASLRRAASPLESLVGNTALTVASLGLEPDYLKRLQDSATALRSFQVGTLAQEIARLSRSSVSATRQEKGEE